MSIDNKNLRPEELEAMTTQQLDELLHKELEKDAPDSEIVLPILHIIEEREAGDPNNDVDVDAVWSEYQKGLKKDVLPLEKALQKNRKPRRWLGSVAAIAAIVCLLVIAVPTAMGTENIFEIIGRWSQTIFEFFNPTSPTEPSEEYVFKTDHPGLQQIYDAVVEQGVTQPVVPRWVPDEYVLDELKTMPVRGGKKVYAGLVNGQNYITIAIEVYNENRTNQYTKDDTGVGKYELAGITHYVMTNDDSIQAVWVVDNLECMVLANCEEEIVYKILKSVYRGSVE